MKKPKALITGIAGFAGSHLALELLGNNYELFGTVLYGESLANIQDIKKNVNLSRLNITNSSKVQTLIMKIRPDFIFHLAAFSSVGQSFANEELTYRSNILGSLNLLKANLHNRNLKKFIFISSSDCYGPQKNSRLAIKETAHLNPVSPYAISKAAAESICTYYYTHKKLPVIISRSFNHSGPKQSMNFVIPSFARQIAAIDKGKAKPIMKVGDLSPRRDFSDVRDIVRGYRQMAEKGKKGEIYNLSSNKAVSIEKVLDILLSFSGKKIKVIRDKKRVRKDDIPLLRGNNTKAVQEIGYEARYSLKTTLKDTLNYWREKV